MDLILFHMSVGDMFKFIEFMYFCQDSVLLYFVINFACARDFFSVMWFSMDLVFLNLFKDFFIDSNCYITFISLFHHGMVLIFILPIVKLAAFNVI